MPITFAPTIKQGKVYRGKTKTAKEEEESALAELQSILNTKNRRSCDCEAQIHDLLENCLNCGRLTCEAEGPGKCFCCGSVILNNDQRERLKKHVDIVQSFPSSNQNRTQQTSISKIKMIDCQFDMSSIENKRHLRSAEKERLKESLNDLQSKRYKRKLVLNVDVDNMEASSSSMPLIDDFNAEIQKLQVCQPAASGSNPTVSEILKKQSEIAKTKEIEGAKRSAKTNPKGKSGDKTVINKVPVNATADKKLNKPKQKKEAASTPPKEGKQDE